MIEGGNVYLYKMIADNGGAPCVADGVLSLAICKPIIRRVAKEGSWIFGFAGDALEKEGYQGNRLIYVAKVTEAALGSEYYAESSAYAERADCIYTFSEGAYEWKKGSAYHKKGRGLAHDLGTAQSSFDRARVLLSNYYRYFGKLGPLLPNQADDPLRILLGRLAQGHRVNFGDTERGAIDILATNAFRRRGEIRSPIVEDSDKCPSGCEAGIASDDDDIQEDYSVC